MILDFQTGDKFGLTGSLNFGSLSSVANGTNTQIINSGNILAIVTGIAPSAIGVFTQIPGDPSFNFNYQISTNTILQTGGLASPTGFSIGNSSNGYKKHTRD